MEKYKYFIKNILLFLLASFIPKTMSFFMVPLYTNVLSTADYGIADLLTNTVTLLMPVLSLQLQDAVLKFSIEKKYKNSEILGVSTGVTCFGLLLLICFCVLLDLTNTIKLDCIFWVFICVNYLTRSLYNIFSFFCRGIDKIKEITISSILHTAVTISCNLVFLLYFNWGLNGYLIANSIGTLVCLVYLVIAARLYRYFSFSAIPSNIWAEMITFSIPMIFSSLSWWVNNASDKYILTFFCGTSVVGIYSVASKIPTVLSTLGSVISKAFSISAIRNYDEKDQDGFFSNSYTVISLCMTAACSGIMLLNIWVSKILFAKDFFIAWQCVPPLLISVLMNQLSQFCESFFLAAGKTKVISVTAIAGAAINTILNLILIPSFGAYGAASATALSFFVTWGIRYHRLRRFIVLKNSVKKETVSYLLLLFQMVLAYKGNDYFGCQALLLFSIIGLYWREIYAFLKGLKGRKA